MTTAPLTAEDFAAAGLDPATETILTADEAGAIGRAFAGWLGIGLRGVIVFPFASLQPVPRPRRATADGRRRLPPSITPEGARHPAWWLDAHTAWQDAGEDDLAYGVRLGLELEHRGASLPGDGPIDALASGLGWPLGDPVTDARVAAYAAGAWDPELCRFELHPHPATNGLTALRADFRRQARELLAPRLALLEVIRARRWTGDRAALSDELALVHRLEGDLDGLVEEVRRCGEQLRQRAGQSDDRRPLLACRQALASSVESLIGALSDLDDASRRHRARPDDTGHPGSRHRDAAALVGAVYATPGDDQPYQALDGRLEAWRHAGTRAAETTRRAITDLLRSPAGDDPGGEVTRPVDPQSLLGAIGSVSPFPG